MPTLVSDIAIFVLKRDVKLQLTNSCEPWYIAQFTAKQHLQFACNRGRYINVIYGRPM